MNQNDFIDELAQEVIAESTADTADNIDTTENLWFSGEKHVDFKGRYSVILNISIRFYDTISIEKRIIVERIINYISYCCCQRMFRTRYYRDRADVDNAYFQIPIYWNRSLFRFMDYLLTIRKLLNQFFYLDSKTSMINHINFVTFGFSNVVYDSPIVWIREGYFGRLNPPSSNLCEMANQWFKVIAPKRDDDAQLELAKFYYFRMEIKK